MKIKIIEADNQRPMWFNKHVGEVFELRALRDGIPRQYEVDVSELVKRGDLSEWCRGIAYVPAAFAEQILEPSLVEYLGERGDGWKAEAEAAKVFGFSVKDLSRDELLMVIGFLAQGGDRWILSIPKLEEAIRGQPKPIQTSV